MTIQQIAAQPELSPIVVSTNLAAPKSSAAAQPEALREQQRGLQDGDEQNTGSKVNTSA